MPEQNNQATNDVLSLIAHGASFFSSTILSIIVPIVILKVSSDTVVKANARESINFQLNMMIWGVISIVLMFAVIGFPMFFAVVLWSLIAPFVAVLKVANQPNLAYRYRFIMHFLG